MLIELGLEENILGILSLETTGICPLMIQNITVNGTDYEERVVLVGIEADMITNNPELAFFVEDSTGTIKIPKIIQV